MIDPIPLLGGVSHRIRAVIKSLVTRATTYTSPSDTGKCHHELKNIRPDENESIWHLENSYLDGESYWTAHDAAFLKTRERVKEFRCFGCGERGTITTGEIIDVRWKDDLTAEEIAELHEQAGGGSWFNGMLWWEDNVWDGNPKKVASDMQWHIDIGYTEWKEDSKLEGSESDDGDTVKTPVKNEVHTEQANPESRSGGDSK